MLVGAAVLSGVVGCAGDAEDGAAGAPAESEESNLTSLAVTLDGTGATLAVDDRPRLKPRAQGSLACGADRFELDGRKRITCLRGDEQLEVIFRDGKGLLVHKAARRRDAETFYSCEQSGNGPEGFPKKLTCTLAPLRDRPSHGGGGLASPFDSTVQGIDIPNAHVVGGNDKLLRSMAPGSPEDFDQLFAANVGAVLIFKNPTTTGHSVDEEVTTLTQRGLAQSRVSNIPFKWKDLDGFKAPCEQVVEGMKFIKTNLAAGKKTLFHCTVGEDRTGFLAAMHRLLNDSALDTGKAWDSEMCEHGYGAGNPLKPGFVVGSLETGLKPLYQKMAYLAKKGSLDSLDTAVCANDPSSAADFATVAPKLDRLTCGTSTLFVP
jgi:hypothetical protein